MLQQNKSSIAVHTLQTHEAWKELLMKEHFAASSTSEKMELDVLSIGWTHSGCICWLSLCGQNADKKK